MSSRRLQGGAHPPQPCLFEPAVLTPAFFVAGASYLFAPQASTLCMMCMACCACCAWHAIRACAPAAVLRSARSRLCATSRPPCLHVACLFSPLTPAWPVSLHSPQKTLGNLLGYILKGDDSSELFHWTKL